MRSIAFLILTGMLTIGLLATAQEDTATEAEEPEARPGSFVPSEDVEADTAVAFPTDI
ncbi:MAG: hypothetical protein OER80_00660 [Gammaproteobacteria bacterium]|nr:hypothetical protein [Gammaproteobacteria bacterium]MDH3769321.1 hypothetical protein [Gammaproteobacteria bacterium]